MDARFLFLTREPNTYVDCLFCGWKSPLRPEQDGQVVRICQVMMVKFRSDWIESTSVYVSACPVRSRSTVCQCAISIKLPQNLLEQIYQLDDDGFWYNKYGSFHMIAVGVGDRVNILSYHIIGVGIKSKPFSIQPYLVRTRDIDQGPEGARLLSHCGPAQVRAFDDLPRLAPYV